MGRRFKGREAAGLAPQLEDDVDYFMALRVWAMGDHNSVDVAQLCHEDMLDRHGALDRTALMRYGKPLAPRKLDQGI